MCCSLGVLVYRMRASTSDSSLDPDVTDMAMGSHAELGRGTDPEVSLGYASDVEVYATARQCAPAGVAVIVVAPG